MAKQNYEENGTGESAACVLIGGRSFPAGLHSINPKIFFICLLTSETVKVTLVLFSNSVNN